MEKIKITDNRYNIIVTPTLLHNKFGTQLANKKNNK